MFPGGEKHSWHAPGVSAAAKPCPDTGGVAMLSPARHAMDFQGQENFSFRIKRSAQANHSAFAYAAGKGGTGRKSAPLGCRYKKNLELSRRESCFFWLFFLDDKPIFLYGHNRADECLRSGWICKRQSGKEQKEEELTAFTE